MRYQDEALVAKIREMAQAGRSSAKIARTIGICHKTVRRVATRHDIKLVVPPQARRPDPEKTDPVLPANLLSQVQRQNFALTEYTRGHSLTAIGRSLGVSKQRAQQLRDLARDRSQ